MDRTTGTVATMTTRRLRPALVLAVWTLLVWTTRIRNIWADEDLSTAGVVGRTALALAFTTFALAIVIVWVQARSGSAPAGTAWIVRAFALWTTGVWVVRATQIALADHDLAFVVVHTALAAVSIGLSVWAAKSIAVPVDDRTAQPQGSP